jgi:hypothetical protein
MSIQDYQALPELLSLKQFCQVTGFTEKTIRKLRDSGRVRYYKVTDGHYRYYKTEIIQEFGITLTK